MGRITVFMAGIFFPLFNSGFGFVSDLSSFENRRPASFPSWNKEQADSFPKQYECFYDDHFTLRNRLIRYFNLFKIICFQISPLPHQVIIGKNGWLYNKGEETESYLGTKPLTIEELESIEAELEYRQDYLSKKGCLFYFLIAPAKTSIYPENLGMNFFRSGEQTWGEQLNDFLTKNSKVNVINVFGHLKEKKKSGELYYKLDSHWNALGAFYTANRFFSEVNKNFPEVMALGEEDYQVKRSDICGGNIQKMLGELDIFSEECVEMVPRNSYKAVDVQAAGYPTVGNSPQLFERDKEIKNSKLPRMLLITDSFGEYIFPILAENFSRSVKIFDSWLYRLNEDIVDAEKPDVMLLLIDEPIVRNLLQNQSRQK